jgi:hypothetical protein
MVPAAAGWPAGRCSGLREDSGLIAEFRLQLANWPQFEQCLGELAIRDAAWHASRRLVGSAADAWRLVEEAAGSADGASCGEARDVMQSIKLQDPGELREAVREAVLREAEEEFRVREEDVERALRYRRGPEWLTTWEDALVAAWPSPLEAVVNELRPEHLACPWPENRKIDLGILVDRSWVRRLGVKAEGGLNPDWRFEPGPVLRLQLRVWPDFLELLSTVAQLRGGFTLRPDVSFEEVAAAGALTGLDVAGLIGGFQQWLRDFAENLAERLVPVLVEVVWRRWEAWRPQGRYLAECLRARGLLPSGYRCG